MKSLHSHRRYELIPLALDGPDVQLVVVGSSDLPDAEGDPYSDKARANPWGKIVE